MIKVIAAVVLIAGLICTSRAYACQFNTDCSPGSRCLKVQGSLYGVCAGGLFPGNENDDQPVYDPLDPNSTVGNTYQFNVDCGPGNRCLKESGHIEGVCVRGR
jgi:hypothetical protein